MKINSSYPVFMVEDPVVVAKFFVDHLGFDYTYQIDWYVSLVNGQHELAFLRYDHETIPGAFRVLSQGALLNVEIDDVDAEHAKLVNAGVPLVLPLRTEGFGQRHAIFCGPEDFLIDLIQNIPPTAPEHVAAYGGDA